MSMTVRLLVASLVLPLSWAFSDSVPLVSWLSHRSIVSEPVLGTTFTNLWHQYRMEQDPLSKFTENDDLCEFDAVVFLDQPGLHSSDLKHLPSSSKLSSRLQKPRFSAQMPYMKQVPSERTADAATALASRCGARYEAFTGRSYESTELNGSHKTVYYFSMPPMTGEQEHRKYQMQEHEETIARILDDIEQAIPNHLVILFGTSSSSFERRQLQEDAPPPFFFTAEQQAQSDGIFARYQLLTPGLIITLLIVFFVLVPILMLVVKALASIQSSVRLDAPRGPGLEKKTQ